MDKYLEKQFVSGVLLAVAIALPAWVLGGFVPIVGAPVFAILMGLLLGMINSRSKFRSGIEFTAKKVLQYSIVLLGFSMNMNSILIVGRGSLMIILCTISVALIMAFIFGKLLQLPRNTVVLIGVGSAICGGSAIAATAPAIGAENEDVTRAISTIFFFNVIAALIFPSIGTFLQMSDYGFGMFAGTAVNDTSSVVATASTWSLLSGNNLALEMATIVKLTRTLAIIPISFFLAVYTARKNKSTPNGKNFSLAKIFPWFIVYFLVAAIINTIFHINPVITKTLVGFGKFMITMAMAAIGFNTNLKSLVKNGIKPVILGLACWLSISVTSLVVQFILRIW